MIVRWGLASRLFSGVDYIETKPFHGRLHADHTALLFSRQLLHLTYPPGPVLRGLPRLFHCWLSANWHVAWRFVQRTLLLHAQGVL